MSVGSEAIWVGKTDGGRDGDDEGGSIAAPKKECEERHQCYKRHLLERTDI